MFYVDVYQPPVYIQPEIVYEQPIYIQPEIVYEQPIYIRPVTSYPTVEIQQRIRTPSGTIIIDKRRERFFIESYENY
jgi:hypothetical protein